MDALPSQLAALRPQLEQLEVTSLLRALDAITLAIQGGFEAGGGDAQADQLVGVGGAFAPTLLSVVTISLLANYWLPERHQQAGPRSQPRAGAGLRLPERARHGPILALLGDVAPGQLAGLPKQSEEEHGYL